MHAAKQQISVYPMREEDAKEVLGEGFKEKNPYDKKEKSKKKKGK